MKRIGSERYSQVPVGEGDSKGSLADQIYERLKREILSTSLRPGTPLVEASLAKTLGASRTPLRDALRRLEHDGLVDIDKGRGARVSEVSFRDAIEAYEIRDLVEPHAARRAAQVMPPDSAERLCQMREVIGSPTLTRDILDRWQLDRELHDEIYRAAGNSLLRSVAWDLRVRTERAFTYYGAQREMEITRLEHIQLIDAILQGDSETAERLARGHLLNARNRLTAP